MKIASAALEEQFASLEQAGLDVTALRAALERLLAAQFQLVADGLLAYRVARGDSLSRMTWWLHLLFRLGPAGAPPPRFDEDLYRRARSDFLRRLYAGDVKMLRPEQLHAVEIRTLGKTVSVWDDVVINRQLRFLRSAHRLAFLGAHQGTVNAMCDLLGSERLCANDARFVFGPTAPMTASPFGPVFDFEHEVAVSPFFDPKVPALSYEDKILVRQPVMAMLFDPAMVDYYRLGFLGHEAFHTMALHAPYPMSYLEARWKDDMRADIQRFTEEPRSMEQLARAFPLEIFDRRVDDTNKTLGEEVLRKAPMQLNELVDELKAEGLLKVTGGGRIQFQPQEEEALTWPC